MSCRLAIVVVEHELLTHQSTWPPALPVVGKETAFQGLQCSREQEIGIGDFSQAYKKNMREWTERNKKKPVC